MSRAVWHLAAAAVAYPMVSSISQTKHRTACAKSVGRCIAAARVSGAKAYSVPWMDGLAHAFWRGLTGSWKRLDCD